MPDEQFICWSMAMKSSQHRNQPDRLKEGGSAPLVENIPPTFTGASEMLERRRSVEETLYEVFSHYSNQDRRQDRP